MGLDAVVGVVVVVAMAVVVFAAIAMAEINAKTRIIRLENDVFILHPIYL